MAKMSTDDLLDTLADLTLLDGEIRYDRRDETA